ncbi:MAG: 50S ribosomal protein L30 [Candidatus Aenigmarchaeota archaeon]|nr:50S ribosomal protein L30 [Candidatus Aenigmarchaeota archaeon]
MYAVIRLRGLVGLRKDIVDTLAMLRLHRKMHCVLLKKDENMLGMIRKVKDYVTWGEIDEDTLKLLIQKRGRKEGNKRLETSEAEVIFDKIMADKEFKGTLGIIPVFRLTPPSGGFKKSIKQHYPKGELGCRQEKINELLKRMI